MEQWNMIFKTQTSVHKKDFLKNIEEAFKNHISVKILYKGSWRTVDPYALNNKYFVAYCHLAQGIRTFRVDRIQEVDLTEAFILDKSIQETAKTKLVEAPNYRGYRQRY